MSLNRSLGRLRTLIIIGLLVVLYLNQALAPSRSLGRRRSSSFHMTRIALTLDSRQKVRKLMATTIRISSRSRRSIESSGR